MFGFSTHSWRAVLSFGAFGGATRLINIVSENAAYLIMGRYLTPSGIGLIHRAGMQECAKSGGKGFRAIQRTVTGIEKEWVEPPSSAGGAGTRAERTALTAALSNRLLPDERDTRADVTRPDAVTTKLTLTVPSMPRNPPTRRAIAARTELCHRAGLMVGAREALDFCDAVEGLDLGVSFATLRSAAFSR